MWLEVSSTNKDSSVIAGYFLKAVEEQKCRIYHNQCYDWLKLVRADRGTENARVAFLQQRNGTDTFSGADSFCYGKSVHNQVRIL